MKRINKFIAPEIKKKLQELQGHFQGAVKFLKSTVIHRNGKKVNLACLPWYLMIGSRGSGKTTLLANAEINYILAKQFKSEIRDIPSSDACNWWVTRDLVLVDVPGFYLGSKFRSLWQSFLQMLKLVHRKNKLQGIIVTLNLPELMVLQKQQEKTETFLSLKRRLRDLIKLFGEAMPIHLMITKCDFLPGFSDFFGESNHDEIAQAWGVTLPSTEEDENLITIFSERFNALIKRLNNQLIRRLHHERNATVRSHIKNFPLHIEQLKESIIEFLKVIEISHPSLCSVYLTSGTQCPVSQETTALSSVESNAAYQPLSIMSVPTTPARAYFVRQFILHHLLAVPVPSGKIKNHYFWRQRIAYMTAVSTVVMASILLGRDFQYSIQQAYSVKNDLSKYQLGLQTSHNQNERLIQAIPLLNSLQQAARVAADQSLLAVYSHKTKKTANEVYRQALQAIVLPDIKNYFENYLKIASHKNPEQVYSVLKAYLMLNDKEHFQADFMVGALQELMASAGNKTSIVALTDPIRSALQTEWMSIPLNSALITEVRKQLLSLSSSALGFVILKNTGANKVDHKIDLGTALGNPPIFTSKAVAMLIPAMFTANAFNRIVTNEVGIAASEALQGNWVLGENRVVAEPAAIDTLAAELHTHYISNYIDIWESLLANIQLSVPQNMTQLNVMIAALTSNNSPLLRLLNTIKVNTSLAPIVLASPKLQSLSVLLANADNNKSSALYGIFVSLQELHTYLETMVKVPEMDEAIFQATVQRMKNSSNDPITHIYLMAAQSPEPMKTWLNMIATKSWYFMLQETSQHIENAWQKNVVSIFHNKIACYYPFNPNALQSVDVQQFSDFFKPQGVLTNFYSDYLQPFVDDTQEKLQWRAVNDQKPLFSSTILDQLERAARLQQLFFPKGDDKLNMQAISYLSLAGKHENAESPINFTQIKLPDQLAS